MISPVGRLLRTFAHADEGQNQKATNGKCADGLLVLLRQRVAKYRLPQAMHCLLGVLERRDVAEIFDKAGQGQSLLQNSQYRLMVSMSDADFLVDPSFRNGQKKVPSDGP